ncbi:MAG: pentapeptide repeat-containing protein [Chloroflexota bacterium]|nr:pentapeptide repeat-containing protein [Chloroflexota bacterium]
MATVMSLIRKLRSPDNKRVLEAVEGLRARGWLEDGSLCKIPLCHVHFEGADLFKAKLADVDFHQAHMAKSNLSMADLSGAKLSRADLQGADFSEANLENTDMFKTNLEEARNLTDEQLLKVKRLWGATMPDGTPYDGRFKLQGDTEFAQWAKVDADDPEAMAYFFGVSLEIYTQGQEQREPLLKESS